MSELLKLIQIEFSLSDEQRDSLSRFPETTLKRAYNLTRLFHPKDRTFFKKSLKYYQ